MFRGPVWQAVRPLAAGTGPTGHCSRQCRPGASSRADGTGDLGSDLEAAELACSKQVGDLVTSDVQRRRRTRPQRGSRCRAPGPERGQEPAGRRQHPKTQRSRTGRDHCLSPQASRERAGDGARPHLPERPEDPDNADPARLPGLQHARSPKTKAQPTGNWPHIGPTMVPPAQIKERPGAIKPQVSTGAPPGT